ncbi:MAG: hypothetical protein FJY37_03705 [Betaproteobacteria bacterium]|nr:hypothetical protein [Betaproteobacteria bacterium]
MAGSTPLAQWRQTGRWPACLDEIWRRLEERHGNSRGTREMIELVRAGLRTGWPALIVAVEQALSLGVSDAAAIQHVLAVPDPVERRRHQIALAAAVQGAAGPDHRPGACHRDRTGLVPVQAHASQPGKAIG